MKMPYDKETLIEAQKEVVRANKLESGYIRPIAFYGSEAMGIAATTLSRACHRRRLAVGRLSGRGSAGERHPREDLVSFTRHHVNINMCRAKSVGTYINSILAHQEAAHDGYDEALLLDVDGFVAEGSGENVFIVRTASCTRPT